MESFPPESLRIRRQGPEREIDLSFYLLPHSGETAGCLVTLTRDDYNWITARINRVELEGRGMKGAGEHSDQKRIASWRKVYNFPFGGL